MKTKFLLSFLAFTLVSLNSPADFRICFVSAMATTGIVLENIMKQVKKKPKVPTKILTSTQLGVYMVQLEGR